MLKDYTDISKSMSSLNKRLNPDRMIFETRRKIRESLLDRGKGTSYRKLYGVHEHRVVAEKMLGRKLLPREVVHHRDGNKRNNNPENLEVFSNQNEHAKYHAELRNQHKNGGDV